MKLHAGQYHYDDCHFPEEDAAACNCPKELKPNDHGTLRDEFMSYMHDEGADKAGITIGYGWNHISDWWVAKLEALSARHRQELHDAAFLKGERNRIVHGIREQERERFREELESIAKEISEEEKNVGFGEGQENPDLTDEAIADIYETKAESFFAGFDEGTRKASAIVRARIEA